MAAIQAPRVDLVVLNGYGNILQLETEADANPFAQPLVVQVDNVTVEFSQVGTNKKVATCEYATGFSAVPAIFETTPRP